MLNFDKKPIFDKYKAMWQYNIIEERGVTT